MEITGKIIAVLPERGGVSQRTGSEWKVQEYVLETQEQYPRKMCFDVFGADKIAQFAIKMRVNIMAGGTIVFVLGKWSVRQLRPNLPQDRCLSLRFRMRRLLIFRQEILKTTCLSDRNGGSIQ